MSKATIEYRGKSATVMPGHKAVIDCYKKKMLGQVIVSVDELEGEGLVPEGEILIEENGEKNVAGYAKAIVNVSPALQEKEITPSEVTQEVAPDENYYGLSKVTVAAIKTQEKTATGNGTVEADEGKYLKKVHVNVPVIEEPNGTLHITSNGTHDVKNYAEANVDVQPTLQEKSVTPTTSEQEITSDEDYYGLKKVVVAAVETEIKEVKENGLVTPSPGKYLSGVQVDVPIPDGYLEPVGDFPITENGEYLVRKYETATVNVQPSLQEKSVTPAASAQEVKADQGKYGLSKVTVNAVPTEEVSVSEPVKEVTATPGKFISKVNVNVPTIKVYSGTSEPTNDIGEDGDIYLLLEG